MPGSVIKKGAVVRYAIVAEGSVIDEEAVVGESPESFKDGDGWGIAVIGEGLKVGKKAFVSAGKMITNDVAEGEEI